MRERREAKAAVFLGNDHAEEFVLLEEVPRLEDDLLREIEGLHGVP